MDYSCEHMLESKTVTESVAREKNIYSWHACSIAACFLPARGRADFGFAVVGPTKKLIFSGPQTVRGSCCKHCSTYMPILGFLLRGSPQSVLQGRLNNVFATSQGCVLWEWEVGYLTREAPVDNARLTLGT